MKIEFESSRLGYGKVEISDTAYKGIQDGITALVGPNGSGKSTLGTILEKGRYAYGNRLKFSRPDAKVKMLAFSDIHALSGMEAQYFAQRMESTMNDFVPTVADIIGDKIHLSEWKELCHTLRLADIEDKKINYLSSGELRKLIIIRSLIEKPDILILDNPYIGLDAPSRDELNDTFLSLRENGMSIVLLLCDICDIPSFVDYVMTIDNCKLGELQTYDDYIQSNHGKSEGEVIPFSLPSRSSATLPDFDIAFQINDGHIRYGGRQILNGFNWTVRKGERWVLTGPNGSGKSLLLSMVCADNPQGYANDITLFDRRRGSGESIWDIKNHIGYVSPEMQLFFKSNSSIEEIIVQGMRDVLNRFNRPTSDEITIVSQWMNLLKISHIANRKFRELSAGEQRLVLVARAFVRQPELLVLDEPLHGLDPDNKQRILQIIETMAKVNDITLIFVTHYTSEIPSCITQTKVLSPIRNNNESRHSIPE